MRFDSLIYLTEQLKLFKGIDDANAYKVDNYISYIKSVIGAFDIVPGKINKDFKEGDFDLSFLASKNSLGYLGYIDVKCKPFNPIYAIDFSKSFKDHKYATFHVNKNLNELLIFINAQERYSELGFFYILEKDNNQELHISYYDEETLNKLKYSYDIDPKILKTYSYKKLYELGFLPDKEVVTSFLDLGLLNENDLQSNNIGNIDDLIVYRMLNTINLADLVNRINNSLSRSKHI